MPAFTKSDLIDENHISGPTGRGSPGDAALMAMVNKDRASTDISRQKSQYYSEVFAYREPNLTPRDRVLQYSVITAEVKTNVIVRDLSMEAPDHRDEANSSDRSRTNIPSCKTSPYISPRDTRDP